MGQRCTELQRCRAARRGRAEDVADRGRAARARLGGLGAGPAAPPGVCARAARHRGGRAARGRSPASRRRPRRRRRAPEHPDDGRPRSRRARARDRAAIRRPARRTEGRRREPLSSRTRWRRERRCCGWDASRDCARTRRPRSVARGGGLRDERRSRPALGGLRGGHAPRRIRAHGPELAREFLDREPERSDAHRGVAAAPPSVPASKGCGR